MTTRTDPPFPLCDVCRAERRTWVTGGGLRMCGPCIRHRGALAPFLEAARDEVDARDSGEVLSVADCGQCAGVGGGDTWPCSGCDGIGIVVYPSGRRLTDSELSTYKTFTGRGPASRSADRLNEGGP